MNFLIDTGANKSYINPEHTKNAKITKKAAIVSNKNGNYRIDSIIHANLFSDSYGHKLPYYVFQFHKFFDGLIGYENLSKMRAVICTKTHSLTIGNQKYNFSKYYPTSMNFHLCNEILSSICTTANGTFLIEDEVNLTPTVNLKPGLYSAENNKALVHLSSCDNKSTSIQPFENDKFMFTEDKIEIPLNFPGEHMNREEKNF